MDRLCRRYRGRGGAAVGGRLSRGTAFRLAAAALCFGAVLLLGWAVQHGITTKLDEAAIRALYDPAAAPAWRAASRLGDSVVRLAIAAAVALTLLYRRRTGPALYLTALVLGGMALNGAAKQLATRVRPGLLQHLEHVEGYSFPSGHSAGIAVLALGLALLAPAAHRGLALAAATAVLLLVGLSRVALGVHWPSDVLAGWIEGVGWVLLVRAAAGRPR